jgi:hypothetical protein
MSVPKARLSLEELGLFNILASIERGQDVDAFLLQGVQTRGFATLGPRVGLTPAGDAMLRSLATRLETEALGDPGTCTQRSPLDPRTTREITISR